MRSDRFWLVVWKAPACVGVVGLPPCWSAVVALGPLLGRRTGPQTRIHGDSDIR